MQKEISRDGMVKGGGDCDADGLNFIEEVSVVEEGLGPISLGDLPGTGGVNVHHTHQFRPFDLSIFFRMELAKVTDTDHSHPDLVHLTTDPSLGLLEEGKQVLDLRKLSDFVLPQALHRFLQRKTRTKDDAVGFFQSFEGLV